MTDFLEKFKAETGLTNSDIITCVKATCPKFSKVQLSMAGKPEYGIQLSNKARKILRDQYPAKKQRHNPEQHRIEISVDDDVYEFLKARAAKRNRTVPADVLSIIMYVFRFSQKKEQES